MTNEPRPFNGAEVARNIAAGHTVKLGDHLVLRLVHGDYVARCERCDCEHRVPFKSSTLAATLEQGVSFVMKHQHKEPQS